MTAPPPTKKLKIGNARKIARVEIDVAALESAIPARMHQALLKLKHVHAVMLANTENAQILQCLTENAQTVTQLIEDLAANEQRHELTELELEKMRTDYRDTIVHRDQQQHIGTAPSMTRPGLYAISF